MKHILGIHIHDFKSTDLEILKSTRNKIEKSEQWMKSNARDLSSRYTLNAAISDCVSIGNLPEVYLNTRWNVTSILESCLPENGENKTSLSMFNDDSKTTHSDILSLIDCGIVKLSSLLSVK